MASHQAFNGMMEEFIEELITTFPEEKALKLYKTQFETLKKANPRKIVDTFMTAISPYSEFITNRDESIFKNNNIEFMKKLNISKWWTTDLSENTKNAIWQYLSTLMMLGTTISQIPSDMLKQIETVAEQCASQMDSSSGGMPNMGAIFSGLQSIMGGMEKEEKK
jgi:hypothetical protein